MRRNEPRGRLLALTLLILGAALLAQVLGGLAGLVLLGAVLAALALAAGFAWWVTGIPFDLMHGGGNFLAALLLWRPLRRSFSAARRPAGGDGTPPLDRGGRAILRRCPGAGGPPLPGHPRVL